MPHIPRSAFHFVNCPLDSWYYFVKLHSFTVRQYRILPFGFLQCIPHGKPPCVVLILPISFRAYKGLAPSGKKTPAQSFVLTKNSCIFRFFSVALQQVCSAHAGHTRYIKHLADSADFKGGTFNKHRNGLIGNRFEMPNVSYTQPLGAIKGKASPRCGQDNYT